MIIRLRTLGYVLLATAAQSASAVLPTVTLDPTTDPKQLSNNLTATASTTATTSNNAAIPATAISPVNTASTTSTGNVAALPPMASSTAATVSNPAASQIQQRLLASLVSRDEAGKEVLSPVTAQTRVRSGNIIEYRGYVINISPERVRNLKVSFDLPSNTELMSLSDLSPERAMGSSDGVTFQYMPLKTSINGTLQELPMSYYKAVRWNIEGLGLNEVAEVKYRVRVK